jgi:hypothetical protein
MNMGSSAETVTLTLPNGEEKTLTLQSHETTTLDITYALEIKGEGNAKTLSFDPLVNFDGKPNAKRVGNFHVEVTLPEDVNGIIWANKEYFDRLTNDEGKAVYLWDYDDVYPSKLTIKWSTLDINLGIEKKASPQKITKPNETIVVEITIENRGEKEVKDIILIDDYIPSNFQAVEPLHEFTITGGNNSDPRLLWRKKIEKLNPNEIKTITYSIRYIAAEVSRIYDFELKPIMVIVNGSLIGVSNSVKISKMVGVNVVKEEKPKVSEKPSKPSEKFPIHFLGIIFIIIVILILLAFKTRK